MSPTPGDALLLSEQHDGDIPLLLTDVIMPRLNGVQLAERLKAVRPDLEARFMSGYPLSKIKQEIDGAEDIALLVKPLSPPDLLDAVRAALDEVAPAESAADEA